MAKLLRLAAAAALALLPCAGGSRTVGLHERGLQRKADARGEDPGFEEDEVLQLNVGGTVFTTLRSTLRVEEPSLLEAIFSGRWEHPWSRDERGLVFLDFDAEAFRVLLNYLRARKCAGPGEYVSPPVPPSEYRQSFEYMLSYFALEDILDRKPPAAGGDDGPKRGLEVVQFGDAADGSIKNLGAGVMRATVNSDRQAVGEVPLLAPGQESKSWTIKLEKFNTAFSNMASHFSAGIVCAEEIDELEGRRERKETWRTLYGWSNYNVFGGGQSTWCGGSPEEKRPECQEWDNWEAEDVGIFKLHAMHQTLSLYLRRSGKTYVFDMETSTERLQQHARLYLSLHGPCEITVTPATEEEVKEAGF